MTAYLSATLTWTVGVVLLCSGAVHLKRPSDLRLALADRRLPRAVQVMAPLVAVWEAVLGSWILVSQVLDVAVRPVVFVVAAVWFAALGADLLRTRRIAPLAHCGCPGTDGPISTLVVGRAFGLAGICAWLAGRPATWSAYGPAELATTLLNAVALAMIILVLPLIVVESRGRIQEVA